MSWKIMKLGDACTIEKGNIGIMKAIPGDYPLVVLGDERRSHNEYQFDTEAVIIPLVSSTGHGHRSMKRIHYQSGKFSVGNILCAVIPKDKTNLSTEFLYRYLDLNKEDELVTRMKGMANVSLPMKSIADVEIPVPPIEIQQYIIKRFDKVEKSNGALSFEHTIQLDFLRNFRQQILQDAVQGKLVQQDPNDEPASALLKRIKAGKEKLVRKKKIKKEKSLTPIKPEELPFEIPDSWVWCRLGDILLNIIGGGTPSKANPSFWNGNIPWASVKDLNNKYLTDTKDKITEEAISNSSTNLIPKENIIVCTRMGLGKIVINRIDTTINQDLKALFLAQDVNVEFFYNFYKTLDIQGRGMTVDGIRQEQLLNYLVALPPLLEQNRIVTKIEQLMKLSDELEQKIKQNQKYTQELLKVALKEALEPKTL